MNVTKVIVEGLPKVIDMENKNYISGVEIILWLMVNPNADYKEFNRVWERSRSTYYRLKRYCDNRLYNYEVKIKEK